MKILFLLMVFLASSNALSEIVKLKDLKDRNLGQSIINGREATQGEYAGVFQISGVEADGGQFSCTGQLHSARLMSTAAHCVGVRNFFEVNGNQIELDCEIEPSGVDGALCELRDPVFLNTEDYLNLPFDKVVVKRNDSLDSVGFGVTNNDGSCGDCGIKHVGEEMIVFNVNGQEYRTKNEFRTVLGYGDSGGPSLRRGEGPLVIAGIHSAVLVEDDIIQDVSIMVDVTEDKMKGFIRNFIKRRDLEACGLNVDCGAGFEIPNECSSEEAYLEKANINLDNKAAKHNQCIEKYGKWRCLKTYVSAYRAKLIQLKAERKLDKCQNA